MMRLFALFVLVSTPLAAADEVRLTLDLKAQSDFDRVDLSGVARLEDSGACVQSQAAALAVAPPADMALLHYHKGFCLLAGAANTHRAEAYGAAADELEKAIEAWPARIPPGGSKKGPPEPVSSGLRALATIARLEASQDAAGPDVARLDAASLERARSELVSTVAPAACSSDLMPAASCLQMVQKGRDWLGWMALQGSDLREAARDFAGSTGGWVDWVAGRQAFAEGSYQPAAERYRAAIARWEADRRESPPNILQSLSPRPDWAEALAGLGGAQLLAGDSAAAIVTLDRAVHEDGSRARPLYLRARAKEAAGDPAGALTDYNLASRTAFAAAQDLASGEAHFYRGIVLYRRKDWTRAEGEFSSALNFQIPAPLHADAEAWRHLAAVAGGSCVASRAYLERSLEAVSPYFPKAEARAVVAACPATSTAGLRGAPAN
jgi:hypothetical protein